MYSNKKLGRIAGLLYLVVIATGLFAEVFVRQALSVPGDAITTAHNIQSSEMLYRLGLVADLFNFVCGLPVVLIIYILFKPVNKYLTTLAMFFVIIQTAIIAVNLLNQFSALLFIGGEPYLASFQPNQLAALAKHALVLQSLGYGIGLVFFGFYCLIIGYLIFKSTLVPKILGVLYAISGLSYLLNSFTLFLFPKSSLFTYFAVPAFIGELSFCLWLLIVGAKSDNSFREKQP
ncbi:MAG: hypothetical protein JWP81_4868 [Ferruginibacter sp.]|nr:hypothetical protein [Ferruginibacter sp.]